METGHADVKAVRAAFEDRVAARRLRIAGAVLVVAGLLALLAWGGDGFTRVMLAVIAAVGLAAAAFHMIRRAPRVRAARFR